MDETVDPQATFPGHHKGERILLLARRHWFVLISTVALFVFLLLFPLILRAFVPDALFATIRGTAWQGVLTIFLAGYYLFLWLFFFTLWVDYYLDVWIVTDERIIDIQQVGLFNRVISEQKVIRVQDVTSDTHGIFPTFLNFGNVFVQTAGERERFVFMQVPKPDVVKKVILKAYEDAFRAMPPGQQGSHAASIDTYGIPSVSSLHPHHRI